jgi:hypothetical protein
MAINIIDPGSDRKTAVIDTGVVYSLSAEGLFYEAFQ